MVLCVHKGSSGDGSGSQSQYVYETGSKCPRLSFDEWRSLLLAKALVAMRCLKEEIQDDEAVMLKRRAHMALKYENSKNWRDGRENHANSVCASLTPCHQLGGDSFACVSWRVGRRDIKNTSTVRIV